MAALLDHPLHSHELALALRVTVRDPQGRIELQYEQPGESFLEQMLHFYRLMARGFAAENTVDIDDTTRALADLPVLRISAGGIGQDTEGIVVGSGSTAVAITDRALGTRIVDGAATGELQYLAMAFGAFTATAPDAQVLATRQFLNESGATVTVRETGIYCVGNIAGPTAFKFCIIRDVLATAVEVADQRTLAIDYTIKATT